MPLFSKVFKGSNASKKVVAATANGSTNAQPQWVDSWLRTRVDPEEVAELLHGCTIELKSRALDIPFLLLPFRPSSDPSAAKTFVRNYFIPSKDRHRLKGEALTNELRMTEVMVLISVMKWCWARLPGGVVSWDTYKMFKIGERDAKYAKDSFATFIPISVDSKARIRIINDFFDLLAALAAHGKSNGLGGHKLSRYAGWWAFEHYDTGKGFDAGYKAWSTAADATCHLFFAFLRAMSPEPGKTNGVLDLPRSLQQLVATTDYPPISSLLSNNATKVVMIVDIVSPTPYALLRRAKNFEYRDDDRTLRQFAEYDDPVDALTDECRRVLRAISTTNQSHVSDAKTSTSLVDPSWSRFEDIGFSSTLDDIGEDDKGGLFSFSGRVGQSVGSTNRSPVIDLNRPTTPSWADFLSSGFADENGNRSAGPILLPPDKMLPPINTEPRGQSSQSHRRHFDTNSILEPGELASITKINIDDAFWWVWISSLAGEEPISRKACFGRCALIETSIAGGEWMVMEEQVKGAAPEPAQGAYIAEKKGFLGFTTKKGRLTRRRSGIRKNSQPPNVAIKSELASANASTLAPDQQAKIRQAALALAEKKHTEDAAKTTHNRRGRFDDPESRHNSIFTLGPHIKDEASPALQWARQYDKNTIRAQYLGSQFAGKGSTDFLALPTNGLTSKTSNSTLRDSVKEKDLPIVPRAEASPKINPLQPPSHDLHSSTTSSAEPAYTKSTAAIDHDAPALSEPLLPSKALPTVDPAPATPELPAKTQQEPPPSPPPPAPSANEKPEAFSAVKQEPDVVQPSLNVEPVAAAPSSPQATGKIGAQSDLPTGQRPNGIKRLFGTIRKSRDESAAPPPAPQANPAVAAARRALESKINPPKPEPTQNNFAKYKSVRAPVSAAAAVVTTVPMPAPAPQADVPKTTETAQPEVIQPIASQPRALEPALSFTASEHHPPKTRRDAEFDELSRVDTREREQADKEFSRFDQGPLLDQPAALPADYPHSLHENDEVEHEKAIKHQSVYSAVTMGPDKSSDEEEDDEDDQAELTQEISANDRWAQIRRNAAERAARFSEDHGNRSRTETRTDDGDTSGEETIESRVARIKARVAELTGNMEGIKR